VWEGPGSFPAVYHECKYVFLQFAMLLTSPSVIYFRWKFPARQFDGGLSHIIPPRATCKRELPALYRMMRLPPGPSTWCLSLNMTVPPLRWRLLHKFQCQTLAEAAHTMDGLIRITGS
jgi:hypothetical protein